MRFDVFTVFPEVFASYLAASVLGRARSAGRLDVRLHDPRDYTTDRHRTTDDTPYGGGGGMVMKPEPLFAAVRAVLGEALPTTPVVLLTPQGRPFTQEVAREFAGRARLALLCGRYEGVDERVRQGLATDEVSIGDYVVTGGELPALVVIDAVARCLPGVLGDEDGAQDDSFATGLLEYPQYTRPPEFEGRRVPEVLLSGDHARIASWRRRESLARTLRRRPDLLAAAQLSPQDRKTVEELLQEIDLGDHDKDGAAPASEGASDG
ncbi:MAG TPA: tRNA (guanosine(37)-N1)-methyltransferase TrmD [Anaerolineales bacterium]|nr:tRNA (guanosine(37)-N1)-methyltransferase TrmD [Anaerolineales bacterium]